MLCRFVVCSLVALLADTAAAQAIPLGTFNGFSPGMTKAAAKAVGYGECATGDSGRPV